jgi:hypothetical protein
MCSFGVAPSFACGGAVRRTTLGVFGSIATGYLNLPKTDWKRSLTPQFEKNEAAN